MNLEQALAQLNVGTKAKRLQGLWPALEAKLGEGVLHAEILRLLNENGIELTERTYKCYLYRYRKKRRAIGQQLALMRLAEAANAKTADGLQAETVPASTAIERIKRPPTFDYDPRGISPELLK